MERMKFPRTTHLFNLGAATRDDLRMDNRQALELLSNTDLQMTVEEKVDGANLGLKWDSSSSSFIGFNRSKTVFAPGVGQVESQFRQLGEWVKSHERGLLKILEDGKHILYGEWLAIKHSIHYTGLTDYFLAFDILNLEEGKFFSRDRFKRAIEESNEISYEAPLFCVPEIKLDKLHVSRDELVDFCLKAKSSYYDGPVEGIYLKWDKGPWLEERAKLVKPEFQQQLDTSGHWSKGIQVKNVIDFSKKYEL